MFSRDIVKQLVKNGVLILDPATTYVGTGVEVGSGTTIFPGVVLMGRTVIGEGCLIGPGCCLTNSHLGAKVTLKPYCVLEGVTVEDECIVEPYCNLRDTSVGKCAIIKSHCDFEGAVIKEGATVGPFCRLRPEAEIGPRAKIGNFVEIKKSIIGEGSKVPHLAYVGDTTMGDRVNFSAGAITCNYDGISKHQTVIEDEAFIGSNVSLVAPITVRKRAFVAAGSTLDKGKVPAGALAVARAKERKIIEGWGEAHWEKRRK